MATSIGFDIYAKDRASQTFKQIGSEAEHSTGKLHSFGKVVAGVFAGGALFEGAQKGIEFLKGSVEAAVQDQQANAILARQLKNTTGATGEQIKATEEWVTKTAEASGVAKSDLTPALTKLVTVTGNAHKAQNLLSLAMNVSAGTHKNLTSVTDALVKAQNGSVGGLSRLGVATKNADGSTKSFKAIQAELAKQFKGDSAASADTAAGKMKRLGVTWEEMKVQVGDKLIPILSALASFMLNKVMPAVGQAGHFFETKLMPPIDDVVHIVKDDLLGAFSKFQSDGPSKFTWVKQTFGQVVSVVKQAFQLLKAMFTDDLKVIQFVWKHFGSVIVSQIKNEWHLIQGVISGALKIIQGILKVFTSIFKGDWKGAWDGIKLILKGAWQIIVSVIKFGLSTLKNLMQAGWTAVKLIVKAAWDGIQNLIKWEIQTLISVIKGIPHDIMALDSLFLRAGLSLMKALFNGLKSAAGAAGGFATDIAKQIANTLIGELNAVLPHKLSINKGPIHVSVPLFPTIPGFAAGTSFAPGGLALVGERGPELVNLPRGSRVYPNGTGPGGVTINVYASGLVDPQTMVRLIETELAKRRRVVGTLAFQ